MFKSLFARKSDEGFKTRSADRDLATDDATIGRVAEAIDSALAALQAEQAGLSRRVEDAVALASLAVGNESDEYVSREASKTDALRRCEDEIRRGRDRQRALEQNVLNLRFLRAAFLTRFPAFNTKPLVRESATPAASTGNSGVG
jgi:hypothetical protein